MRSDDDARRLELRLVALRWIVAGFGAAQVFVYAARRETREPSAYITGVREFRGIGVVAFSLDAIVILLLVWLSTDGPADPVWVVGYLVPLEGAARWGLPGAAVGAIAFLAGQLLPTVGVPAARPR